MKKIKSYFSNYIDPIPDDLPPMFYVGLSKENESEYKQSILDELHENDTELKFLTEEREVLIDWVSGLTGLSGFEVQCKLLEEKE